MNFKFSSPLIIPVLAATIAGVLSYGITRHAVCRAAGPECDRLRDVSFLKQELNLSEAQVKEVRTLHDTLASTLDDVYARHCRARVRLGHALAHETNASVRVDAALNEMCRAYEDGERATLDHIRRVRDILDPEQRKKFNRLLKECLCLDCPLCGVSAKGVSGPEHEHGGKVF